MNDITTTSKITPLENNNNSKQSNINVKTNGGISIKKSYINTKIKTDNNKQANKNKE